MANTVTLISPYSSLTSIDISGYKTNGIGASTAPNTTAAIGNVVGYTYNAAGTAAQLVYVNTDHGWIINGTGAADTINGGIGNDTINVNSGTLANSVLVYGGAGSDIVNITSGSANLADFTFGTDKVSTTVDVANFVKVAANFTTAGYANLATTANVALTAQNNFYEVTLTNGTDTRNVWFGSTNSATMDGSTQTAALVMHGDNNGTTADTLIGGSGKDTIYAGAGDYVDGKGGSDTINVVGNSVAIALTATSGKDVTDSTNKFGAGFATDDGAANTVVYLTENKIADATITSNSTDVIVSLSNGSASLDLQGIGTSSSNTAQVLVKDVTGTTYKVAVANTTSADTTMTVGVVANYADIFVGSKSNVTTVDFTGTALYDSLVVDLGNTGNYGSPAKYVNIKAVTGSDKVDTKLIGAAGTAESLKAGAGVNTSLWGGGSAADTLIGGSGSDTFFFGTGDGKDVVTNFKTGTGTGNDTLYFLSGTATTISHKSTGDLTVTLNSSDVVTLKATDGSTADAKYKLNIAGTAAVAKIGLDGQANTLTYDSEVNYYYGSNKADTISYTGTDNQEIWLNNSTATKYYGVENITASTSTADVKLMGDSNANVITGGQGTSTLWGGAGNDTLVGGTGTNIYGFGKGDGNDIITTTNSKDQVNLYNVATADLDLTKTGLSNGTMTIALTDGSTATLKNYGATSVNTFVLTDATYTYDYTKKTGTNGWSKK